MKISHRLSSADFRAMRPARRINGVFFSLSLAPSPAGLKWACAVSKKVSVKAVTRNLVKRRCRSVLQVELKNVRGPLALVFHAKRGADKADISDIKKDIEKLLSRAELHGTMRGT